MNEKLLLVTFPVDFGNTTLEKRLVNLFEGNLDLKVYRFVPSQHGTLSYKAMIRRRFLGAYGLWKAVYEAQKEGRKILFHGISPALFAYPVTIRNSSYIFTDWTRKLYEPIHGASLSPQWLTFIHQQVLKSQKYIFGLTNAVIEAIEKDYHVPKHKLKKAKLPFSTDLNLFSPSPQRADDEVRILFVGGDLYRKGGDVLIRWFDKQDDPNLRLTMVTKSPVEASAKISVEGNIQYGQLQHTELFKNHDIFVLPTMCDGYPSVLGEAACAGLAILTTKYALGAPEIIQHGVNGYICSSQEELLEQLNLIIKNKPLIEMMKRKSRELMEKEFKSELVLREFMSCLFD